MSTDDQDFKGNNTVDPQTSSTASQSKQLSHIDFSTFLLSLSTSALYHLGIIPEEGDDEPVANLPMAKQTIDIIELLEEKTRGNLTTEEADLFTHLLYDLRLRYVDLAKKEKK